MGIAILIGVVILVAVCYFANEKHKEMVASGTIVKRASDFEKQAEIFTCSVDDWTKVYEAVKDMSYEKTEVSNLKKNDEKNAMLFVAGTYQAQLCKVESTDGKGVYKFSFLRWDTRRGIPYGALGMNILLTNIEKTFLKLDAETKVTTQYENVTTKASFF